jgi:O-antigen ligase
MLADFPIAGTGLNTYGIAALEYQEVKQPLLFIEAHNDYLQVAAEGGLLLGVPALILLTVLVTEVRRRFAAGQDDTRVYWLRVGAVIGLCVIAFQSFFDFTLQMPGAAVLFVVLAGLAAHQNRSR